MNTCMHVWLKVNKKNCPFALGSTSHVQAELAAVAAAAFGSLPATHIC